MIAHHRRLLGGTFIIFVAKRGTKSFESLVWRMDSNGNEISRARDVEGEENASHQTVETRENNDNRKRTLESSVKCPWNDLKSRALKISLNGYYQRKWQNTWMTISWHSFLKKECKIQSYWKIQFHQMFINRRRWMILLCYRWQKMKLQLTFHLREYHTKLGMSWGPLLEYGSH